MKKNKLLSLAISKTLHDVYKFLNFKHLYLDTEENFYLELSKFLKEGE